MSCQSCNQIVTKHPIQIPDLCGMFEIFEMYHLLHIFDFHGNIYITNSVFFERECLNYRIK